MKLWKPEGVEPRGNDWYVAVDDIENGIASLEISVWPEVADDGSLHFEEILDSRPVLAEDLQKSINRLRKKNAQAAPTRSLRVGDAFWVRAAKLPADAWPATGIDLRDVTADARQAAKDAMLRAATVPRKRS